MKLIVSLVVQKADSSVLADEVMTIDGSAPVLASQPLGHMVQEMLDVIKIALGVEGAGE